MDNTERPVVILSDLHFGKKGFNMVEGARAYEAFFRDMDSLKKEHGDLEFILAGDIFDLWRSYARDCIPAAGPFFRKIKSYCGASGKITYIPGNHDHFIKQKLFGKKLTGSVELSDVKARDSESLRALKKLGVDMKIVYPDRDMKIDGEDVKVTHGHFFNEEIGNVGGYIVSLLLWISLGLQVLVPSKRVQEWFKCILYPTIFKWTVRTFSDGGKPNRGSPRTWKVSGFKRWMSNKLKLLQMLVDMRMDAWGEDCDLVVAGHTHVPGYNTKRSHKQDRRYVSTGSMLDNMATYITIINGTLRVRNAGRPDIDVVKAIPVHPLAPTAPDPTSWPVRLSNAFAAVKRFLIYGTLMLAGEVSFYSVVRSCRTIPGIRLLFQFDWFVDRSLHLDQVWTAPAITLYGQASLWMFLVYGWAIFFGVEMVYRRFRWLPILVRVLMYAVLIGFWECVWGWVLLGITGYSIWEYGDTLSIFRYTSLAILPLWGILGLLSEKVFVVVDRISHMEFRLGRIRRGRSD